MHSAVVETEGRLHVECAIGERELQSIFRDLVVEGYVVSWNVEKLLPSAPVVMSSTPRRKGRYLSIPPPSLSLRMRSGDSHRSRQMSDYQRIR